MELRLDFSASYTSQTHLSDTGIRYGLYLYRQRQSYSDLGTMRLSLRAWHFDYRPFDDFRCR